MKNLALILLLSLVFVSACLQRGTTTTVTSGKGLEIINYSSDQTDIASGRSIRLNLEVENQGETTVNDSTSLVYLFGSNLNLGDKTGLSWNGSTTEEKAFKRFEKDMRPEDTTRGLVADKKLFTWRLTAPELSRGQTKTDTFTARVYYEYETIARGTIWVYSEGEAEAVRNAGGNFDRASYELSKGPLRVETKISPDPPIVSSRDNIFTIELKLSNIGGGTIYMPNGIIYTKGSENVALDPFELNQVNVLINSVPGLTITGCTGTQELIGGRDTTLLCDAKVTNIPSTKSGFAPIFRIRYGYYIDRTLSISVSGR